MPGGQKNQLHGTEWTNKEWFWFLWLLHCNIAGSLMFYLRNSFLSFFKLSITHGNLVDYTFVNKNETFIFSPYLITPEFRIYWVFLFSWQWHYLYKFNRNLFSLWQDIIGKISCIDFGWNIVFENENLKDIESRVMRQW